MCLQLKNILSSFLLIEFGEFKSGFYFVLFLSILTSKLMMFLWIYLCIYIYILVCWASVNLVTSNSIRQGFSTFKLLVCWFWAWCFFVVFVGTVMYITRCLAAYWPHPLGTSGASPSYDKPNSFLIWPNVPYGDGGGGKISPPWESFAPEQNSLRSFLFTLNFFWDDLGSMPLNCLWVLLLLLGICETHL